MARWRSLLARSGFGLVTNSPSTRSYFFAELGFLSLNDIFFRMSIMLSVFNLFFPFACSLVSLFFFFVFCLCVRVFWIPSSASEPCGYWFLVTAAICFCCDEPFRTRFTAKFGDTKYQGNVFTVKPLLVFVVAARAYSYREK